MAKGQAQGVVLGYLRYILGMDSLAFQEGLGDADKRLKAAQKSVQKTADKFTSIGAALSVGVSGPLVAMAAKAVQGAKDQAAAVAQVDAAIKSMGNTAGLSSDQLSKFADGLELKSLFDADEILKKSTANLLTFGNVAGANFKLAQQAAVDLATRMGGDLQGATLMIGKALNDPVKGLTALSRAGIQFTAQQKEQIKAMQEGGNVAGAQAIMLAELNRQFGGAAAAAAKSEPMREVMVKLGQAGDQIGEKLLPIIPVLAESISSLLDAFTGLSPETQKWVLIIGGAAAALGPVAIGIGGLVSGFGAMLPLLAKTAPLFTGLAAVMTGTVIPVLATLGRALIGLAVAGGPLTLIAAAVAAVVVVWKNWDTIGPIVQRLYSTVKSYILDKLGAVWAKVEEKINAVKGWFFGLYDAVVGHSYIPDMVDEIGQNMARLQKLMVDPAQSATQSTGDQFRAMAQRVGAIVDGLFPKTAALRQEMENLLALQNDTALSPTAKKAALDRQVINVLNAQDAAQTEINPALGNIEPLTGALDDAYAVVAQAGKDAASQIKSANEVAGNSFVDMANKSLNALSNLAQSIKSGGVLDILSSAFNAFGQIAQSGILGKGLAGSFANFTAISGFRANGGPVSAGKSYVVGERGPELFTASRSGYVHANSANDNASRSVSFDLRGAVMTEDLLAQMNSMASGAAQRGAMGGHAMTMDKLRRSGSRRLA